MSEVPAHERDRHAACAFKGAGCPTVMVPPSMGTEWLSRHQRECGYRTVPCPLTTCEERVKERFVLQSNSSIARKGDRRFSQSQIKKLLNYCI